MPFGSVTLVPGVDVEQTPTLLKAGFSQSQHIRFKDGLVQKYGGFSLLFQAFSGAARELHVWQDLRGNENLGVGTTTQLGILTGSTYTNITPQTLLSDFSPNFSTIMNSATVTIADSNITVVSNYDSILFNTPVSVGGLILSGVYPILESTGSGTYEITAASAATSTVNNGGAVPTFTTTNGSAIVQVNLTGHGVTAGEVVMFQIATTGNGVTIFDNYPVISVVNANAFTISASVAANASSTFSMNGGNAELLYYIGIGPQTAGSGYGLGTYGTGGYGLGTSIGQQTGSPITATDWTSDNWGEIYLACPAGGGVYQFDPTSGAINAQLIPTAPIFNGGLFVSMQQQILVCWGSTIEQAIGVQQNPLVVAWSNSGDYTNFTPTATDQAGNFVIPTGSKIYAGIAAPNQDIIITDIDCWAMNYIGFPNVFGFNKIGAGAGAVSSHAVQQLRGNVFWMGPSNFYNYNGSTVSVIPCPVWDFVFQNLNTAFQQNVRAMPNTPFNEVGWLFPSNASVSGECDSYVKMNLTEPNAPWDYGNFPFQAWTDQSVLGPPISAGYGLIYLMETTNDAAGQPLFAGFETGYFFISEGEDFSFVDQIYPDFIWTTFGGTGSAQIQITINAVDYPGDTPSTYGPYTVTNTTQFIPVRIRARQMQFVISSDDAGSFWRLGKVRFRYQPSGRR